MADIKSHRTVKLPEGLVQEIEKFLKTKDARKIGLTKVGPTIEYYVRKGIEEYLKSNK